MLTGVRFLDGKNAQEVRDKVINFEISQCFIIYFLNYKNLFLNNKYSLIINK